ncbi:MAG TPA: hypothetical protein VHO70_08515, partial [Chitinispirillaceae bacterium]|nr:hypothetical protein [Chitinispirillaceae bacterium]
INTRKIAGRLSAAKKIRIINEAGTDFTFQTDDSNIITDDGRLSSEGGLNVLPAGQVYLTPLESSCQGHLVMDGYFSLARGKLQQNLTFEVQGGMVCGVENHSLAPELEKHFNKYKEAARCISGLGIGVLDTAKVSGNITEDRVSMGAIHLTFGKGLFFGATHGVPNPLEAIISRSTVFIDGKFLMQDGVLTQ